MFKNRWIDHQKAKRNLIKQINKSGRSIDEKYSPFELLNEDYIDFRGLEFDNIKIKKIKFEKADLSYSGFTSAWIENCIFKDVIFESTDFTDMSDHGNQFINCIFLKCKFNYAALGYNGTRFTNCTFNNSNFTKAIFIRGEFTKCEFRHCKLKGIDFDVSSFEDCNFIGELNDVWFRGNYALASDVKHFGLAKKNKMENVSFKDATLTYVMYTNNCDLSTIRIPNTGNYQLFDNWKSRLEKTIYEINTWSPEEKKEAESFMKYYLIHAITQDWYLINVEDLQEELGIEITERIIANLKA